MPATPKNTTPIRYIGPMELVHLPEFSEGEAIEPMQPIDCPNSLVEKVLLSSDWEIVPAEPAKTEKKDSK